MNARNRRARMPSASMVVACAALIVALAQPSYAAVSQLVPNHSVGTIQLKAASVGTAELKKNAVNSTKVRDFSLRRWDFRVGDIPRGPAGPRGRPGVVGDITLRHAAVTVPASGVPANGLYTTRAIQVRCASGERAISGGTTWSSDENGEELVTVYSRPLIEDGKLVGWRGRGGSDFSADRVFTVQVLCAPA